MRRYDNAVLSDDELLRLLIGHPQLLAVADAVVVTQAAGRAAALSSPRMRRSLLAVAAALVLLIGVGGLVSSLPGGANTVDEALAAVGSAPVLHVVIATNNAPSSTVVDIATGQPLIRSATTEIWYDPARDLKRTLVMLDGRVVDEQLETRTGGFTSTGPIFTCDWIRKHPAEAERAGVSCGEGSDPSPSPTLDAAVSEFVDGYRRALASGAAREVGEGSIGGRDVVWLEFAGRSTLQRVAIDAETHRPVQVESADGTATFRVLNAESIGFAPSIFTRPKPEPVQIGGSVVSERKLSLNEARRALGQPLLWLQRAWAGFALASVTEEERSLRFGSDADLDRVRTIRLTYVRQLDGDRSARIEIFEASRCLISLGWTCGPRDPGGGQAGFPVGPAGPALLERDGVFVSVWGWADQEQALELLRQLQPILEGP